MYKCKCGNSKYFKETYQVETIVTVEDGENANSYDKYSDLIMVTCLECKNNTEDGTITNFNGETLLFKKIIMNKCKNCGKEFYNPFIVSVYCCKTCEDNKNKGQYDFVKDFLGGFKKK